MTTEEEKDALLHEHLTLILFEAIASILYQLPSWVTPPLDWISKAKKDINHAASI